MSAKENIAFRKSGWLSIIFGVVLIALAIFIGWGVFKAAFLPTPPLQGEMEARTISIASKVPGRIARILVREGENVKKGQMVAELALPGLDARLSQAQAQAGAARAKQSMVDEGPRSERIDMAKAQWDRALADADLAHKTWERIDALYRDGLVSAERHDQARAKMQASQQEAVAVREEYELLLAGSRKQEKAAAEDQSAEAAAGVREVESLTQDHVLYAPRDGQIDKVLLVEGEILTPGFPAATLVDLDEQWASFNLLEKYMPGMAIGKELLVNIPAIAKNGAVFEVYYISPRANYATWRSTREDSGYDMKTFEIRARPKESLPDLRPGMSVLVNME